MEHKDIDDEGQTVDFPEIKTNATNSETGDHIANADSKVTILSLIHIYWSVNAKYANKTEEEKAALRTEKEDYYYYTDTNQITQNFRVVKADGKTFTKVKFEKKGKNQYKIIDTGTTLPEAVQHGKKDVKEFTTQKLLAWNVTGDHYQTLAYGADDPGDFLSLIHIWSYE